MCRCTRRPVGAEPASAICFQSWAATREAPWDQRTCEIEPNANFVFSHTRNDALIACDHHVENANSYNEEDFPF